MAVIQSSIVLGACSDDLGESIEIVPLGIQAKVQQVTKIALALCNYFPSINRPSADVLRQHSALRRSSRLLQDLGRLLPSTFDRVQTPQTSLQRGSSTRNRVEGWIDFCCCAAMQFHAPMDHRRRTLLRAGITPHRPQSMANRWLILPDRGSFCEGKSLARSILSPRSVWLIWPSTSLGASTLRCQERPSWWVRSVSVFRRSPPPYTISFQSVVSRRKSSPLIIRHRMIITIAFRLSTFNKAGRITNPTLLEDLFIVWTQTELNYSFISATILNLRPFVNNLNTQFGGLGEAESGNGYGYGSGSGIHMRSNGSYQMSNLKSVDRSNIRDEYAATQSAGCWDGQCNAYSYGISVPSTGVGVGNSHSGGKKNAAKLEKPREEDIKGDATSVGSNDSRRMIIRKDMSWKLEYEAN